MTEITTGMAHALSLMRTDREYTTSEIMVSAGLASGRRARELLGKMRRAGLVERVYHSSGGKTQSRWVRND